MGQATFGAITFTNASGHPVSLALLNRVHPLANQGDKIGRIFCRLVDF
jgi:hypothetical protein